MTPTIKPWARGPFEVLFHAEMHYRQDEDFDRRIAMIGFDNAIEFTIASYLNLKPIHRSGKDYDIDKVKAWLKHYHTRIEFFYEECASRGVVVVAKIEEVIWVHNLRNEQYHGGGPTYPGKHDLDAARAFALQVFSVLFDAPDVNDLLEKHRLALVERPERTDADDKTIDGAYGLIELCGQMEYASDVLYAVDPNRYRDTALTIRSARQEEGA